MDMSNKFPACAVAALEYAARGWHVFPVPPGEKKSHKSAAHSDGRKWGATTDADEIRRDWTTWPNANVGIVTGAKSGFFVVEADTQQGHGVDGIGNLAALIDKHGGLPDTIEALSPSGSWHIYFRWPEGGGLINSAGQIAPGVDVRAEGGMVLGVPSVKPGAAQPYRWKNPPGFFDLADCPEWLLDLIRKPKEEPRGAGFQFDTGANGWAETALRDEIARVLAAPDGGRNHTLNRAAYSLGQIVAGGALQEGLVADRLAAAGQAIGLDPSEIAPTVASGLAAGMKEPRGPKENTVGSIHTGQAKPAPIERQSRFYSAADLQGRPVPDRQWLVHGMIPQKTVTLFGGDGGTGKSLSALQLAVAAVLGTTWAGRSVKQGSALFISAEDDDDELHRRLDDILRAEDRGYRDVAALTLRSLAGEDALLAMDSQLALIETALFKELEARAEQDAPGLIVIDTLADVYPANENDRAKVRQFVGILRGLALRRKCAVVLLGHPSLTGLNSGSGTSGSTAWNNSVRSRLYLSRIVQDGYEPDANKRVLSIKKANYGETGTEIGLTWRDGVFWPDAQETSLDRMAGAAKGERVFLKLLRLFTDQGRRVNHAGGPTYAPKLFSEHPDNEGMTKRALRTAMDSLLASGQVRIETEGPPSRRVTYIVQGGAS